jgi:hypothetical protein
MEWNIVNNKDIDDCMESGDIACGHAILTAAMFLKKIANNDSNEVNVSDVKIDKMTSPNESPDDTILNLELEMAITNEIRKIGRALVYAADSHDISNTRIINSLRELVKRNQ